VVKVPYLGGNTLKPSPILNHKYYNSLNQRWDMAKKSPLQTSVNVLLLRDITNQGCISAAAAEQCFRICLRFTNWKGQLCFITLTLLSACSSSSRRITTVTTAEMGHVVRL
jgi:hypothetical protein